MILQKKLNEKGEVECYKARLVVHKLRQRSGINFDMTSAVLVGIPAVRLVLAVLGLSTGMTIRHIDVTTAYQESKVNDGIHVTLAKGIILLERCVRVGSGIQVRTRLLGSLYDLKQVSLNWFKILTEFLLSFGL